MNEKNIITFSAPSGTGKTTLLTCLLNLFDRLELSISATSRKKRGNEIDGVDYYFVSHEEFISKIASNDFVEYEEVYPGHYYGTLHSEVERIWKKGFHIVFDIDVKGALALRKKYPNNTLLIFIAPPSMVELEKRLRLRGTENEGDIVKRINKATIELSLSDQFDYTIVNDDLDVAINKIELIINQFLSKG